jgi:hypothetical protein
MKISLFFFDLTGHDINQGKLSQAPQAAYKYLPYVHTCPPPPMDVILPDCPCEGKPEPLKVFQMGFPLFNNVTTLFSAVPISVLKAGGGDG